MSDSDRKVPERRRPELSEVRALVCDSTEFRRQTGWKPRVSLLGGLERTVAWWRARFASGVMGCDARFMT